jgi:light-regulated signal transduction histidine kinase (bacteriophytochrome)
LKFRKRCHSWNQNLSKGRCRSLVFFVQDNGIKEQDKDKIFVLFKRLHDRNEYEGTGIGLSQCEK